jgi:hypothetical protein
VLETEELDSDELDDSLSLLLDDELLLDDDERDEPPVLLSELLLLLSSGMSVHVAHIRMVNALRRMRSPPTVSPAMLGPDSLAPYTVNPLVRLSH